MSLKNEYGVIISNDRDRKVFNFLLSSVNEDMILWAVKNLDGNRKPYVSNIVKLLKIEVPHESTLQDPGKVIPIEQGIEMLKRVMKVRPKQTK